ncbi:MAG: ABC transporter ATP-binding protein/permease [Anaerolineales bacterium]|nr:ABC transporter ATP-binding protein/permease [Anaerolineales bacterium]
MSYAIQALDLTKHYPLRRGWLDPFLKQGGHIVAVEDAHLAIQEGELFGLLGPNGAGKTTLIKMLATLIVPTRGEAWICDHPLADEAAVKASLGLVTSDERSFFWRLTGRQNLEFFARLYRLPGGAIPERVQATLDQLQLSDLADTRFSAYSTGKRQLLSIARALLHQPRVLLLDEPTKGLDPSASRSLQTLIREELVGRQGVTVLLSTHNLAEAEAICDRVAVIHQGRIRAVGALKELGQELHLSSRLIFGISPAEAGDLAAVQAHLPGALVEQQSPDTARVSIALESSGDGLDQAIAVLQGLKLHVTAIEAQNPDMETIFADTLARPADEAPVTAQAQGEFSPSAPPGNPPAKSRWQPNLCAFPAFLKRDLHTEASYRFSFLMQILSILFSSATFYFIAQLLGDSPRLNLARYGGDYFAFVLIGIAFAGYFGVGLSSFAGSIRQAQTTGTLEAMLATPTSLSEIILASSQWDYLLTTLRVLVYLLVGGLFLGVDLSKSNLPAAGLALLLAVIVFSSLGILAASFIMVLKRGDPITWLANAFATLLGGVYFPIDLLPPWLSWLSKFIPVTYALEALRLALLQGAGIGELTSQIVPLLVFCLILVPLSLLTFRFAVYRARIEASLTHY